MSRKSKCCCLVLVVAAAFAANGLLAQQDPAKQKPAAEKSAAKTPREQLDVDIADLRRCLKQKDYRRFIEFYVPVKDLRQIRKSPLGVTGLAAAMAKRPELFSRLDAALAVIKDRKPVFTGEDGMAVFDLNLPDDPTAKPRTPTPIPLDPDRKLIGLGDNLAAALARAEALLKPGSFSEFVERTFPESELRRADSAKRVAGFVTRLKGQPGLVKKTLSDLQAARRKQPVLSEDGRLATISLNPETGMFLGRPKKLKPRELKFQKINGHWRLYDNTTAIRREIARLEILEPVVIANREAMLSFERIGNHWRLTEMPR